MIDAKVFLAELEVLVSARDTNNVTYVNEVVACVNRSNNKMADAQDIFDGISLGDASTQSAAITCSNLTLMDLQNKTFNLGNDHWDICDVTVATIDQLRA